MIAALLAGVGCHYDMDSVPFMGADKGKPVDKGAPDDGPVGDLWSSTDKPMVPDLPIGDHGCALGTADHCSKCGDKCPGPDDISTLRACTGGQCTIKCKGYYYDVNGSVGDGCEFFDKLGKHADQATAKDLGSVTDCDSEKKANSGAIPSDSRSHVQTPFIRLHGTPKWFKIYIKDTSCMMNALVKVDLKGLPASSTYKMEAHHVCASNSQVLKTSSKTGKGGTAISVYPALGCSTPDDSGTLFVRIRKLTGVAHSTQPFVLSIRP